MMADTDKECLESPEAGSSQAGFWSRASLIASSASRTVKKQVSFVISHPLCGNLHGGPRKQMQMAVMYQEKIKLGRETGSGMGIAMSHITCQQ